MAIVTLQVVNIFETMNQCNAHTAACNQPKHFNFASLGCVIQLFASEEESLLTFLHVLKPSQHYQAFVELGCMTATGFPSPVIIDQSKAHTSSQQA